MISAMEIKPGDRVCIAGQGADVFAHSHAVVDRVTKTMIIVGTRRFRRDDSRSIPYSPYGGTRIATHCQKKKK